IAAVHAMATRYEDTDWHRIADLYRELSRRTGSPVVELNRAVAISMAHGPIHALRIVDALTEALAGDPMLRAVRGYLLERLQRREDARAEYARDAELPRNDADLAVLLHRARDRGRKA